MDAKLLISLVLFLPLIGSLFQALLGGRIVAQMGAAKGKRVMGIAAVLPIALAFIAGALLTQQTIAQSGEARSQIVNLLPWIDLMSLKVPFELLIDPLSLTMVLIITGVGSLIHLYATGYMGEEKEYTRFFTYLNLFISAMLILVLGNNLALMFIGWEGVGLCSYLLIAFWYKDVENAKAGNKAFIVNRIGDWGLTLGMFMLMSFFVANLDKLQIAPGEARWLSYDVLLPNAAKLLGDNPGIATAIALLLFVGACGKSAQFPLYFWLPDAMAGPTPVSALIHAATMVTSGVVMLNRLHVLFELSPAASAIVASVGAFTALFAAVVAFGQTDIKKVLAYSTVSQLGFMFIGCGVGGYWTGMFHVTTHAFFKALLFLGSGAVIYSMAHNQDMRNYGNLKKYLPITCWTMFIGYLAIAGFPMLSGFFSKEAILGYALANDHAVFGEDPSINLGYYAGVLGLLVAGLTAAYMTRMTWLTFFGGQERWRGIAGHDASSAPHDEHPDHDSHSSHGSHHHEDPHGFFLEEAPHEEHEHHHDLDAEHTPKEAPISMTLPLIVLAVLSAGAGWFLERNELFEKWLSPSEPSLIGPLAKHPHSIALGGLQLTLMQASLLAAGLGIAAGLAMYWKGLPKSEGWDLGKWASWRKSAANQFGYDSALVSAGTTGGGEVATAIWKYFDSKVIDGAVNGVGVLARKVGGVFKAFQTGYVRSYALMMLFGTVGILSYFVYLMTKSGGPQ